MEKTTNASQSDFQVRWPLNEKQINTHEKTFEIPRHGSIQQRNRFPTLHEVLYRQTASPVDLWSFYCYMRDNQKLIDYLDFWLDSSQHLLLCQRYVAELKEKLKLEEREHDDRLNYDSIRPPAPDKVKSESMSSSVLLNLIMSDNILDDSDSHRLSAFLRGERGVIAENPEVAEYIANLHRQSMSSEQLLNELNRNSEIARDSNGMIFSGLQSEQERDSKRISTINPELIESFIYREHPSSKSAASYITRDDLRKSAREIFLTYFNTNSIKSLKVPDHLNRQLVENFENGRDDPDIFDDLRSFVFKVMENELFPGFLTRFGIMNIPVQIWRFFTLFVLLFIGFWVGYVLIFLDYSRATRCVVIIPFALFSYLLISYIYCVDPILCLTNYSYNLHSTQFGLVPINDKFVKKILVQRSLWVSLLIVLITACLSVLFIFVPGRRL